MVLAVTSLIATPTVPGIYIPLGWGSNWRTARAQAGTTPARVSIVADSLGQGYYSSDLDTKGWALLLRNDLQSIYGDGGSGWKSSTLSDAFAANKGVTAGARTLYATHGYITTTGTWGVFGGQAGPGIGNALSTVDNTTPATATLTVRGTTVKIYTISNSGGNAAWQYQIDGGALTPITDGSGFNVQVTTITGLAAGVHTITITYNDAGVKTLYVVGVSGENATGLIINNHSVYGSQASSISTAAYTDASISADWLGGYKYQCDLAIWGLGLNDTNSNITGDAYAKSLRRWLLQIRDGTLANPLTGKTDILVILPHVGKFDVTNFLYQDYAVRLRSICSSFGAAMLDFWELGKNSYNYWSGLSYWSNPSVPGTAGTDTVHPSDAGHAYMESVVLPLLTG